MGALAANAAATMVIKRRISDIFSIDRRGAMLRERPLADRDISAEAGWKSDHGRAASEGHGRTAAFVGRYHPANASVNARFYRKAPECIRRFTLRPACLTLASGCRSPGCGAGRFFARC